MTQTALLTLGRMPKGWEIARALHQAGVRVVVADPMAWHAMRPSRWVDRSVQVTAPRRDAAAYHRDLLRIVEAESVSLIVPVAEEALHVAAIVPDLPEGTRFFGADQARLLALHDKQRFIAEAARYGLAVPATFPLGSPQADGLARATDVMVKRVFSCSGVGLTSVRRGDGLPPTDGEPRIVQVRLRGREVSSFSIAHRGRVLVTVVYEATVLSGTVAVAFRRVTDAAAQAVGAWVARFAAASEANGFLSFDFIVDADGVAWGLECNPRVTSGVHFLEPEGLAQAILAPETEPVLRYKPQSRFQQIFPTGKEAYAALFRQGRRAGPIFRELLTAPEVMWDKADPWPLLLLALTSYEILGRAIFGRMRFGEAASADIAWRADDRPRQPAAG